jgi:hypothetical protein
LPDPVPVRELASALHLSPFKVVASLMEMNLFCSVKTQLDFDTAAEVCATYGVAATKAP